MEVILMSIINGSTRIEGDSNWFEISAKKDWYPEMREKNFVNEIFWTLTFKKNTEKLYI